MCELLVRVKDKASDPDPGKDALISKRGHVVALCDDGWQWSKAERDNPEWVIVRIPGVSPDQYSMMVAAVIDGSAIEKKLLARRAVTLDLTKLPALAAMTGESKNASVDIAAVTFDAAKVATPAKVSIEVIG